MTRHRITCLALVAAAALAACGDEARRSAEPDPTPVAVASAERYCAIVGELDAAGERHFASLGRDAGPEEFEAAERAFIEANAGALEELEAVAPPDIAADVRTLLAAQRARAGMPPAGAPGQKQATAAERRIKRFERRHC